MKRSHFKDQKHLPIIFIDDPHSKALESACLPQAGLSVPFSDLVYCDTVSKGGGEGRAVRGKAQDCDEKVVHEKTA